MFLSRRIGSRGWLFTFDDLVASRFGTTTNIYVLEAGRNYWSVTPIWVRRPCGRR